MSKRKSYDGDNDKHDAEDEYLDNFFLPIIFHNLKNYDAHFVMKHFEKIHVERRTKKNTVYYDDVKVIPLNSEKYMTIEIDYIRFLDSYQFLSTSLDHLVTLLLKSGREKFVETTTHPKNHDDLVFAKAVYPYSYMTSIKNSKKSNFHP